MRTTPEEKQEKALKAVQRFGALVTCDHIVLAKLDQYSQHGDTVALVMQDFYTQWIMAYPNEHKDVNDTFVAMQDFALHDEVLHLYSDNASEISKAAIALKWRHSTCTPNRPQSNGAAEQAVRRVLDGTRTILYRSGFPHSWWAEASKCYCCLRNITDVVKEGKTPYELRHSTPYPGLRITLWSLRALSSNR